MRWFEAKGTVLLLAAALTVGIPAAVLANQGPSESVEATEPTSAPVQASGQSHGDHDEGQATSHDHEQDDVEAPASPGKGPAGKHLQWRYRTPWPAAVGEIPTEAPGLNEVRRLEIEGEPDKGMLDEEHGIELTGAGTQEDPYILEGLHITDELELKDTRSYWVIKENLIDGELRLNWNDDKVHVHHNKIRDLRVNENIERKVVATAGLIEENEIGIVGQIRHFDGIFRDNEVGPVPDGFFDPLITDAGELMPVPFRQQLAINVDGYDGAMFLDNTIHGAVDIQLHGHHHASCFGCFSHNHGDMDKAEDRDHTVRYHMMAFTGNTIEAPTGPALRYQDTGHSGDDETATSEPYEALEADHVHYTYVLIDQNEVTGGPAVVDIFNADDEDHHTTNPGMLVLEGNQISYEVSDQTLRTGWFERWGPHGVVISETKEMGIQVTGNEVTIQAGHQESVLQQTRALTGQDEADWLGGHRPAAVHLVDGKNGTLAVTGNTLAGTYYGVLAEDLGSKVDWTVTGNLYEDIAEELVYDRSVESQPER